MIGTVLLAMSIYWHLPLLIVLVSIIYSATRTDDWPAILYHAVRGGVYIITFMGAVFLVLFFFSAVWPLLA